MTDACLFLVIIGMAVSLTSTPHIHPLCQVLILQPAVQRGVSAEGCASGLRDGWRDAVQGGPHSSEEDSCTFREAASQYGPLMIIRDIVWMFGGGWLVVVLAMIVGAIVLVLKKTWPGEDGDDR